ncbi:helix-turn-helix domain-containing protein [Paenibacillus herberti]|uniref:helix-turn-helix domain-containing protein n=1 Tax=Paenibacillus herberti TaxID=1619309 RepID=UPI001FE857FE|nr:helix-turn-helix transcriptional regulator [Paenibacillus herberti]
MSSSTSDSGWSGIGSQLRKQRQLLGWTQRQLANRLGLAKSTVSQYENDINEPDYAMLLQLCHLFGVSTDYLLGLDGPDAGTPVNGAVASVGAGATDVTAVDAAVINSAAGLSARAADANASATGAASLASPVSSASLASLASPASTASPASLANPANSGLPAATAPTGAHASVSEANPLILDNLTADERHFLVASLEAYRQAQRLKL